MRRRALLLVGVILVSAGLGVALVTALSGDSGGRKRSNALLGPALPPHFRVGDFTLRDADRRPVRLGTPGRVTVMTFLHSLCHSTCPVTAQVIRGGLDDLSAADRAQVDTYAITVAPREDTPAHVRAFLREQRVGGFMRYLIGPVGQVRALWKRYGIHPLTHGEDHSAFIFLVDRRGVIRVGWPSHQVTPEDVAHDLRILVAEHV